MFNKASSPRVVVVFSVASDSVSINQYIPVIIIMVLFLYVVSSHV